MQLTLGNLIPHLFSWCFYLIWFLLRYRFTNRNCLFEFHFTLCWDIEINIANRSVQLLILLIIFTLLQGIIFTEDGIKLLIKPEQNTIILRDISSKTPNEDIMKIFLTEPADALDASEADGQELCPPAQSVRSDMNDTWWVQSYSTAMRYVLASSSSSLHSPQGSFCTTLRVAAYAIEQSASLFKSLTTV